MALQVESFYTRLSEHLNSWEAVTEVTYLKQLFKLINI